MNIEKQSWDSLLRSFLGGRIFWQTIGIPMVTNCAPLLTGLFLYSYEAELVQSLLKAVKKHIAQQFNFTCRYIDDVLSLKNTKFAEYLEFIYARELEIKVTTETAVSSSYLDCYLYIDNGKLITRLYDKRDDFNFSIVNFPFLSSNIPSAPAYGVLRITVNPFGVWIMAWVSLPQLLLPLSLLL